MKLLLVMLLVSGLLIGESTAQRPFIRFFGNLYTNFRNRLGLGITTTTTASITTIQATVTVTTTVTEAIGLSPNVELVPPILLSEPEINAETMTTESEMLPITEETITEGSSTDNPLIFKVDDMESTTTTEDDQVELEIVTQGPELDHSDATVIESLAQFMLEVATETPESLTTESVVTETEAMDTSSAATPPKNVLNSTTFSTLAPKRTIHFSKPGWTPTFLKLANRASTRYFFPATFRLPKSDQLDAKSFSLNPSKPLSVDNSVAPRIPYVVKRHIDIESSMTVPNQQQSSALTVRAATD